MNQILIESILQSGQFPHPFQKRTLVETHISYVILGTSYAYKFKKDLQYSFLDFSTLPLRKYYCERELHLNNRLTKGMYLKVVTARQSGSGIIIDGEEGEIIDYAIQMKRMQDSKQMHVMLEKRQVNENHIRALAKVIRKFHRQTDIIHVPFDRQKFSSRFNDIKSIADPVREKLGDVYAEIIEKSIRVSDQFLHTHDDLFTQRVQDGWIRDCHGDLHSRNIFLYAHPVIFDCIEFNDEFRQIDILDELAFFCMDLEAEGYARLSTLFIDVYFQSNKERFGQKEKLLFTYYKAYRANVRAKVNGLRLTSAEGKEIVTHTREIQKYLSLMDAYLAELT